MCRGGPVPSYKNLCANKCPYLDLADLDQVAAIGNEPVKGAREITVRLINSFEAFSFWTGPPLSLSAPAESFDAAAGKMVGRFDDTTARVA